MSRGRQGCPWARGVPVQVGGGVWGWGCLCTVKSKLNNFQHVWGDSCIVSSNASWVIVTWHPLPVDRITDRLDWTHCLPAALLAGGKNTNLTFDSAIGMAMKNPPMKHTKCNTAKTIGQTVGDSLVGALVDKVGIMKFWRFGVISGINLKAEEIQYRVNTILWGS